MTLASGARLGPYEIVAPLGAGGMGEVYRAKDPRLGREVAIKVLPAEVASDPERLRRFEQEAKAVSALNHPHIVTLHEIGSSEFGPYLVLEKIDGQSLREMVRGGALPVKRVLTLGAQIAEGLAKAHTAGIVHRDLKPENVMVSADGFAKILDFGLAKLVYPQLEAGAIGDATTLAEKTGTGMILGTIGYLSPEQAVGKPADFRSDQFALGALLYELATGERPFRKETVPESLAAVIREVPKPLRVKDAALPPQLGWIVERCLEKDPGDRYGSTKDLARDLADLCDRLTEIGQASVENSSELPRARFVRRFAWPLVSLALAGAILWQLTSRPRAASREPPSYRPLTFQRGVVTGARFSPDGLTVYYSAAFDAEPPRVYMTRLEGTGSAPLELPPATLLSVSSKGELALLLTEERNPQDSPGMLARATALGGTPRPLLDGIVDADWAPDGEQLAILRHNYDLELPPGLVLASEAIWPRISPRGDRIAYAAEDGVRVVDLEGRTVLDHKISFAYGLAWRSDGREIWFSGDIGGGGADKALYALSLSGERRLLATAPGAMTIQDIARDGKRALVTTGAGWWGIQAGSADRVAESTLDLFGRPQLIALSGDGKQALLYEHRAVGRGLYLRSTDGARTIRLSDDPALGLSPDGSWVLAGRNTDPAHLFLIPTGAGEPQQLELDPGLHPATGTRARWSGDGRQIFLALAPNSAAAGAGRIYRLDPPKGWRPVTPAGVFGRFAVSPDGQSIATRDLAGSLTLYPIEGGEPRTFAEERGIPTAWSSDGRWLYLVTKEPFRVRIYRCELASGRVESWRDFGPPDPAGVTTIGDFFLSGDGLAYAYSFSRVLNVLYLVEGLE